MQTTVETITPEMAAEILKNNKGNRPLIASNVKAIEKEMRSGNWSLTHQGIAFSSNGNLLDGQHRLAACVKCGIPFTAQVTRYNGEGWDTGAGAPFDIGQKRPLGTYLGAETKPERQMVETAKMILSARKGSPDSDRADCKVVYEYLLARVELTSQTRAKRSTAPIRAGVCAALVVDGSVQSAAQYSHFVNIDSQEWWPSVHALLRVLEQSSVRTSAFVYSMSIYAAAFVAFNERFKTFKRIVPSNYIGIARAAAADICRAAGV